MSGCLSWSSSGQGGVITRAIMLWVRKQVQQVDKTRRAAGDLLAPIAQRWAFLVLFTKRTFGTQQADGMKAYSRSQRLGSTP
jgi:hypothetical protein